VFSVLPAQNATGNWVKVVQRIPLRVAIADNSGGPDLRAGMSAEVDIDTHYNPLLGEASADPGSSDTP
jgi:membrane fusion protein (multidrug efflux system)